MNVGVAAIVVLSSMVARTPESSLQEDVRCAEIGFSRTAESRDREAFASFLHPDARFVSAAVSRGPAAILAAWAPFLTPDGPSIRWRPETVEVSEAGDVALSRGPFRIIQLDADGERTESWGSFISFWRRTDDGEWRIQFDTGGDVGMTPTEAQRELLESDDSDVCRDD